MAIGLTFEEYVDLTLMTPKQADRAFLTTAQHWAYTFKCIIYYI